MASTKTRRKLVFVRRVFVCDLNTCRTCTFQVSSHALLLYRNSYSRERACGTERGRGLSAGLVCSTEEEEEEEEEECIQSNCQLELSSYERIYSMWPEIIPFESHSSVHSAHIEHTHTHTHAHTLTHTQLELLVLLSNT